MKRLKDLWKLFAATLVLWLTAEVAVPTTPSHYTFALMVVVGVIATVATIVTGIMSVTGKSKSNHSAQLHKENENEQER